LLSARAKVGGLPFAFALALVLAWPSAAAQAQQAGRAAGQPPAVAGPVPAAPSASAPSLGSAPAKPAGADAARPSTEAPAASKRLSSELSGPSLLPLPSNSTLTETLGLLDSVRAGASDLVTSAMAFLGVPYRRGGKTAETGFDCSGFTRHIFESTVGMLLPHRAEEQARLSDFIPIRQDELKPGDLVFFNTMRRTFSHVGIYVGAGQFIHAPRVGGEVRVEDMRVAYWQKRFTGARRAAQLHPSPPAAPSAEAAAAPVKPRKGPAE
jgi:cell wall-associated NlpC family hydrolase